MNLKRFFSPHTEKSLNPSTDTGALSLHQMLGNLVLPIHIVHMHVTFSKT